MAFQGNGAENGGPGASNAAGRMGGPNNGSGSSGSYRTSQANSSQKGITGYRKGEAIYAAKPRAPGGTTYLNDTSGGRGK